MTDQERILGLEQLLRILAQVHCENVLVKELIRDALIGERPIPLPPAFEPKEYVAANLLSFLKAHPEANTGDWYGQLIYWCESIPNKPSPNAHRY